MSLSTPSTLPPARLGGSRRQAPKAALAEHRHLGFMYIGTAPCGCQTAWAWDDEDARKSTSKLIARVIKRGDTVTRVERFAGDSIPQVKCQVHLAEQKAAS